MKALRAACRPLSRRRYAGEPPCLLVPRTPFVRRVLPTQHLSCSSNSCAPSNRHLSPVSHRLYASSPAAGPERAPEKGKTALRDLYEDIYTVPNLLTLSRIIACPAIGYFIVQGDFVYATSLLFYAGVSDLVDGYIARRYNQSSVLGSILDPAADKLLMTTLVITLAVRGLLPTWLAIIIIGRDVLLSISAFYWRYISLPPPKTFARYWNFSIPSAEVHPTQISKYNTFLQLALMGSTTISPLIAVDATLALVALQYTVAVTTVASGLSYIWSKDAVKVLRRD